MGIIFPTISLIISESLKRIETITGKTVPFEHVDLLDKDGVRKVFAKVGLSISSSICHFFIYDVNIMSV